MLSVPNSFKDFNVIYTICPSLEPMFLLYSIFQSNILYIKLRIGLCLGVGLDCISSLYDILIYFFVNNME